MGSLFEKIVTTSQPQAVKSLASGKSGALVATYRGGLRAVLKPVKERMPPSPRHEHGATQQRGILVSTHPYRERAYYKLAKLLKFTDLVPETVLTTYNGVDASAQIFVTASHLSELNKKLVDTHAPGWSAEVVRTALLVPKRYWRQLLALDFIAGARDRHANNIGIQSRVQGDRAIYRLVAWDNAVTFGLTFAKYHNVFHKFMFRDQVDYDDVWPTLDRITLAAMHKTLDGLITDAEIEHAYRRLCFFRDDFPYRLPWRVCSKGENSPAAFPAYADYFTDEESRVDDA